MRIAILGFAREGKSILKFIEKDPRFEGAKIYILDKDRKIRVPKYCGKQIGKSYLSHLERFGLVFRSPGIPYNLPQLKKARRAGVRFSSLTKLFFESASRKGAKIIGVTGTKGKGTTSTLLYKILTAAKYPVVLAGNIGTPALNLLSKLNPSTRSGLTLNRAERVKKNSWVVLELSSFQLQDLTLSPPVAIVLDVFPDHQDSHRNLEEYYESKANIARYQKRDDIIFFFEDNALSRWVAKKSPGHKTSVDKNKFSLFAKKDLKIKGSHNFRNAVMAATVAKRLGVPSTIIRNVIQHFSGLEHRLEFVRKTGNVSFYNDSASTNPQTSAAAIRSFPRGANILIAGGQDKGLDYKPLARALKNSNTSLVILFGENKKKIEKALRASRVPLKFVSNLRRATRLARQAARKIENTPVPIIFSPGAASFDMFRNYADRGEKFKLAVRELTKSRR